MQRPAPNQAPTPGHFTLIPGTPKLLVGKASFYEWQGAELVARPDMLADVIGTETSDGQYQEHGDVMGLSPNSLYIQITRRLAGSENESKRLMHFERNRWRPVELPIARSNGRLFVIAEGANVSLFGCDDKTCQIVPLAGPPKKRKFSATRSGTRLATLLDVALASDGRLYALGIERNTAALVLEKWPTNSTPSTVVRIPEVEPLPKGHVPSNINLDVFDDNLWIWGLEWFHSAGSISHPFLATSEASALKQIKTPCADDWPISRFEMFENALLLSCSDDYILEDGEWKTLKSWPTDLQPDLEHLPPQLPCPAYAIPLPASSSSEAQAVVATLSIYDNRLILGGNLYQGKEWFALTGSAKQAQLLAAQLHLSFDSKKNCMQEPLGTYVPTTNTAPEIVDK